ncbi:MAG: FkbM family methyltransferase [Gemmatimonadetes bacterium]|nr:FkbM family methyltransferase [Gemmatimonadota bacterium]
MHKNPWRLYDEIFLRECYEPLIPLRSAPRILDVGANIGLASLYFLWRWPSARLEAWEPNPTAFELLTRNVVAERFPEAELKLAPVALSTSEGTAEFVVPSRDPTAVYARISPEAERPGQGRDTVRVRALDARSVFAEPADLVKLDIEGHEYAVLDHSLPDPFTVPALMIEFHRVAQNRERFMHHVTRLTGEGGYWMTDGTGIRLSPSSLSTRKGSVLLRFFRDDD